MSHHIEDEVIRQIKVLIDEGRLVELQILWEEISETEFDRDLAWDYIFQKVYLHAALKKRDDICEWLDGLFEEFNPMIQIALRQMFAYARYLRSL
jgi:hypothetical protein